MDQINVWPVFNDTMWSLVMLVDLVCGKNAFLWMSGIDRGLNYYFSGLFQCLSPFQHY